LKVFKVIKSKPRSTKGRGFGIMLYMSENESEKISRYSPEIGSKLRDRTSGQEKHSPYHLFNYAWSRLKNFSPELQKVLVDFLEKGDVPVVQVIEGAIELERVKGKDAASVVLENDLLALLLSDNEEPRRI